VVVRREAVQKRVANRIMACSCRLKNANMPGDFKHDLPRAAGLPGRRLRAAVVGWLALALASGLFGAKDAVPPLPEFRRLEALPAIREAGAAARMAGAGWPAPVARDRLEPGDGVTVLVSLTKGTTLQQWLIDLAIATPRAGDPLRKPNAARLYTSTGHDFRFDGGNATIEITMVGPLRAGDAGGKAAKAPEIKRQRVNVSVDYLALGLERVPAKMIEIKARRQREPNLPHGDLSVRGQPFPADVVARDGKSAAALGISSDDERSIIGSVLALQEFLQLASRTPGLQDVVMSVLDVPWWSIIRSGGRLNFDLEGLPLERELDAAAWGLPATTKAYASPFRLHINGQAALVFQLALVAPRPPLTVSAGIIGLAAVAPDGKGPVLTFQVIGGRMGEKGGREKRSRGMLGYWSTAWRATVEETRGRAVEEPEKRVERNKGRAGDEALPES